MANDSNSDSQRKVPKLKFAADYIQWRRRMKAYFQRSCPLLLGLKPRSTGRGASSSAAQDDWVLTSARATGRIILCLGDPVASQTRLFVDDDDKTAGDLWNELEHIFMMSNAQVIQNQKQKLKSLIFKDDGNFDKHVASFLTVIGELATYDVELSESEQTSKLLRSLPPSFVSLAMVSSLQQFDFDTLVNAVQAELARRSNSCNTQRKEKYVEAKANISQHQQKVNRGQRGSRNTRGHGRGGHHGSFRSHGPDGRAKKRTCDYCGVQGHIYRNCWRRIREEEDGSASGSRENRHNQDRRGIENCQPHQLPDTPPPRNSQQFASGTRPFRGWGGDDRRHGRDGERSPRPSSRFTQAEQEEFPTGFLARVCDDEFQFGSHVAELSGTKTSVVS